MAEVKPGIIGEISGKIGNVVLRSLNGKSFLSIRPGSYNISQSEDAVKSRTCFRTVVKFASFINSIPELSIIWKNSKIVGNRAYNKIIKNNLPFISSNALVTNKNFIIPEGVQITFSMFSLLDNSVVISFAEYEKNILLPDSSKNKIYILFCFQEPVLSNNNEPVFSLINAEFFSDGSGTYNLTIELNEPIIALISKYKSCVIFFTIISKYPGDKTNNWSASYAKTIDLIK